MFSIYHPFADLKKFRAFLKAPPESGELSFADDDGVLEPVAYDVAERRKWVIKNIERAIGDPTNRLFAVIYIQKVGL